MAADRLDAPAPPVWVSYEAGPPAQINMEWERNADADEYLLAYTDAVSTYFFFNPRFKCTEQQRNLKSSCFLSITDALSDFRQARP